MQLSGLIPRPRMRSGSEAMTQAHSQTQDERWEWEFESLMAKDKPSKWCSISLQEVWSSLYTPPYYLYYVLIEFLLPR